MTLLEQYQAYSVLPFMQQWVFTHPHYKTDKDAADAAVFERIYAAQIAAGGAAAKEGKRVRYIGRDPAKPKKEVFKVDVVKRIETRIAGVHSYTMVHMQNGDRVNSQIIEDADSPAPALELVK